MKEHHSSYELYFVAELRRAARALVRELGVLRTGDSGVLSMQRGHVLIELQENGPMSASDIMRRLCMKRSTTQRQLERMKADGLLKVTDHPNDRRCRLWCATEEGLTELGNLNQAVDERVTGALDLLAPADCGVALIGLQTYVEALRRSRRDSEDRTQTE